jgi:hypothetical protein
LFMSTFFRRRNSAAGSPPVMTGVPLLSIAATDAARECDWNEGPAAAAATAGGNLGAFPFAKGAAATLAGGTGCGAASIGGFASNCLFRAIMGVNSCLNFSLSWDATGCGDVKVKLCPRSFPSNPIFSLTCGAPSLLQNRAVGGHGVQTAVHDNRNTVSIQSFDSQLASLNETRIEGALLPSCVHCRWVSVSSSSPGSFLQDAFAVQTRVGIDHHNAAAKHARCYSLRRWFLDYVSHLPLRVQVPNNNLFSNR